MTLCKNCIYISNNWRDDKRKALCKHEDSITYIDPVDGEEHYRTCYEARISGSICGRHAALFISKAKVR